MWFVILFWTLVAGFCINIALQIYFDNRVSRVDEIKIRMARLEPLPYVPERNKSKPTLLSEEIYLAISGIADEIHQGIQWMRHVIISIVSPKLYAIIG